jgi:hypothetical protein
VEGHQVAGDTVASDNTNYEVSVKVGDTIYVVLYSPRLGELPAKYTTGRALLVLVEKDEITYNNMLGRSLQVAIESQRPASAQAREVAPAKEDAAQTTQIRRLQ